MEDYQRERLQMQRKFFKELREVCPFPVIGKLDSNNYEQLAIIQYKNIEVKIRNKDDYRKQYHLWLNYSFPCVSGSEVVEISDRIGRPNNIGVLTAGKIKAWCEHYAKVYEVLKETNEKREDGINEFKSQIADLPVKYSDDKQTRGVIEKNGIEFRFNIDRGYITTEFGFTYEAKSADDRVKTFIQLSNNQFKK